MNLYLIRHAHAVDLTPDHARPLSDRGREQIRALAKFLHRSEAFSPEELWHSPLVRAQQTAELLADELKFSGRLREVSGLRSEDDPREIARQLMNVEHAVAVVGHEPHLSALGSLLVTGATDPVVFDMKKGAVLALERSGRLCVVRWHIAPAFLQ
jgi:phosphohistidine phosphatase